MHGWRIGTRLVQVWAAATTLIVEMPRHSAVGVLMRAGTRLNGLFGGCAARTLPGGDSLCEALCRTRGWRCFVSYFAFSSRDIISFKVPSLSRC